MTVAPRSLIPRRVTARRVTPGRWAAAVALAAAVAVLAGCASVPTSGPIRQGPPIAVDEQDLLYRAIPQPPQPGMAPDEIVRAFLAASSSGSDAYNVARQFLTPAASTAWDPRASVRIYDGTGIQTKVSGDTVVITGVLDGTIGRDGDYVAASGGKRLQVTYRVTKVDGEWRIAVVPDGLVLGRGDVDREFRTYNTYFFDPTYAVLVPDPITVPVVGSSLPTTMVRALLQGPTNWLAPAVRTAFPDGTTLTLGSVPVDNGIAQVELSSQVLSANDPTREALSAQLVWTLRRLPNVVGVRITVAGQPLTVPGAGAVQDADAWSSYDPDALASPPAYAVGKSGLVRLADDGSTSPVPGGFGTGHPQVTTPAVSPDRLQVAGVSADDRRDLWVQSVTGSVAPQRVLTGAVDLSRPSWDRTGALWVVDRGGKGLLMITDGKPVAVAVADLPSGTNPASILGVSIAPDGTRAVLLLRSGGGVVPWLARVERDGATVRLAAPRRLERVVVDAYDVDWNGSGQFCVLGADGAGATKLFSVSPGFDQVVVQVVPANPTSVASSAGAATLIAAGGRLYRQVGGSWTAIADATDPAYPD